MLESLYSFGDVAKNIIKFIKSKAWKRVQTDYRFVLFLKRNELPLSLEENESFENLYLHTLVQYGLECDKPETVKLFALQTITEAFKNNVYHNEEENLLRELEGQLHINRELSNLKQAFPSFKHFLPYFNEFKEIFETRTTENQTPAALRTYNQLLKMQEQLIDLQEENFKKSFDYQIDRYLSTFGDSFKSNFIDSRRYVPVKTEVSVLAGITETGIPFGKRVWGGQSSISFEIEKQADIHEEVKFLQTTKVLAFRPFSEWLSSPMQNLLVIVGEYGTGKTTFSKFLTYNLGTQYLNSDIDKREANSKIRIPLFLPLRNFEERIDSFIINECNIAGITDIDYPRFLKRAENGEFLLILDGFDEMTNQIDNDQKRRNFNLIRQLIEVGSQSKVLLTVREEYFTSFEDFDSVFKSKNNRNFRFLNLLPFDDEQIQLFLSANNSDSQGIWRQIQNVPGLNDIASRPVLLEFIVKYLPEIIKQSKIKGNISAADLYKNCIDDEISRKDTELNFVINRKERFEILEHLATWMYANDTLIFEIPILEDELKLPDYFDVKRRWEYEKYLNEFLTFSFLLNEGNNRYRISHKSFRDFLAAKCLGREIINKEIDYLKRIELTDELVSFIGEIIEHTETLLSLLDTNAKDNEENQWLSTNLVKILLKLDSNSLRNQNLRNSNLKHIDFTHAKLENTDFTNSILDNCTFGNSILSATLTNSFFLDGAINISHPDLKSLDFHIQRSAFNELNFTCSSLKTDEWFSKVKRVNSLLIESSQISDLEHLSEINGLRYLSLRTKKVKDLNFISKFNDLKVLTLREIDPYDYSFLRELLKLERLYISGNTKFKTKLLSNLNGLKLLILHKLRIGSLEPLRDCENLEGIYLRNIDSLYSLNDLKHVPQLKELDIWDCSNIKDIKGLEYLQKLQKLWFRMNMEADSYEILKKLKELKILHLTGNKTLANIDFLANHENLENVSFSNTAIRKIDPIVKNNALYRLWLNRTQVSDISVLRNFPELIDISIAYTEVEDFSPLEDCLKLEQMSIDQSQMSTFFGLKTIAKLNQLTIYGGLISNLFNYSIEELTSLESITFRDTQVDNLDVLAKIPNLKSLSLIDSELRGISDLPQLTKIEKLSFYDSHPEDIEPIIKMKNLKQIYIQSSKENESFYNDLVSELPHVKFFLSVKD